MRGEPAHLSDEALVEAVARADDDALGELYDRFGKVAYGLAFRILQDAALAEDAVQEAFLQIWRSAGSYEPERAKASTWLLTFVHRRSVDIVRREERRRTLPAESAPEPAESGPDEPWSRAPAERSSARPSAACPRSSGRRSSSPTTAVSRSRSSPNGWISRWARSRAACSRGCSVSASCWPKRVTRARSIRTSLVEVAQHLKGRDFTRIGSWNSEELKTALDLADELKGLRQRREPHELLPGRTLGMIFQKPSTRTRVSFEVGITELGGHGLYLAAGDLQLGRGETIKDTAVVLSRYLDAIMIRTFAQDDVEQLAEHASVPVINGLTDYAHPCQALADLMTIRERLSRLSGVRSPTSVTATTSASR